MKFSQILPFVAAGSALVLPPEQILSEVRVEDNHRDSGWYEDVVSEKEDIFSKAKELVEEQYTEVTGHTKDAWREFSKCSKNGLDEAFEYAGETADIVNEKVRDTATGTQAWLKVAAESVYNAVEDAMPDDDNYDVFDGGHHGRPGRGRRPHHPPHHQKPNLTVYQMIAESKYTTKLAELIGEFDDLVEALNSTKANYTVFAPTDKALSKIPDDAPKPSKEQLKKFLSYHVIPDLYTAKDVFIAQTAPMLLKSDSLGSEPLPQRVSFQLGLRGITVNLYARVVAVNIFGTNGVIHGVDTPIFPPLPAIKTIDLLPGEFSTLELGLGKTGLLEKLNTTDHAGGTLFAPSNFAFKKLGPKINAFLFSQYGLKYLKALLKYHVVPDNTVYSDAYYKADSSDFEPENVPKGRFHIDLPTMLEDRRLAVDIARYGAFVNFKVNAFSRVAVRDGVVEDGVIHVVSDVIVPPKKIGGPGIEETEYWMGEEMSVQELVERLEPYMSHGELPKNDL